MIQRIENHRTTRRDRAPGSFPGRSTTKAALFAAGVLAAVVAVVGPRVARADRAPNQTPLTDGAIEAEVESELLLDPAVELSDLEIKVDDGIVTIDGEPQSLGEKRRAATIARTVRGVRSVVNRADVKPDAKYSDERLSSRVEAALLRNPATESFEIQTEARPDGTVTLTGTVDSWREKDLAERVAAGVGGVTAIRNQLDVAVVAGRTDAEMKAEIEQALRWDTLVDEKTLSVTVEDGVATLVGVVGSSAERTEAVYDAYVRGITRVDARQVEVVTWARERDRQRPSLADVPDSEIRAAIIDAMQRDPRVDQADVKLRVKDGVVVLSGSVASLQAKRAAAGIVRRTTGVLAVNENLTVSPTKPRPDSAIESDVVQSFAASPTVDAVDIEAHVRNGVVTLTGQAASNYEKSRASRIAEDIIGVKMVRNQIAVAESEPLTYAPYADDVYVYDYTWYDYAPAATTKSDAEIASEIRDELWWSPFVDSEDVAIVVDDGVATLTGVVDSWTERESATENAYEGGAVWVDNDLGVR